MANKDHVNMPDFPPKAAPDHRVRCPNRLSDGLRGSLFQLGLGIADLPPYLGPPLGRSPRTDRLRFRRHMSGGWS